MGGIAFFLAAHNPNAPGRADLQRQNELVVAIGVHPIAMLRSCVRSARQARLPLADVYG